MSDDLISGLLAKRTELTEEVQKLQTAIYHLDATLVAFGYKPGKTPTRRFANGELIKLIGEAERAGVSTVASIARWVVKSKDWNVEDRILHKRVLHSVKECRKRMNARGV